MNNFFDQATCSSLFNDIKKIFKEKKIFQNLDRQIVFLCGGKVEKKFSWYEYLLRKQSLRYRFLKYTQRIFKEVRIFLAEVATKEILSDENNGFINLAEFESFFAKFSDCILIFLESPGSIAELSYFSAFSEIAKKIFLVNDLNEQGDSFINLGPIAKVEKETKFPKLLIDYKRPNFQEVKNRIQYRFPKERRPRFRYRKFSKLEHKVQLYVIFQIVYIFGVITIEGLNQSINEIFEDNVDKKTYQNILSFLIAVDYIKRVRLDDKYFTVNPKIKPFLEFDNYDVGKLQNRINLFFDKYHKESYYLLKEI